MSWGANEGLPDFLMQLDREYSSAHEWRQRHMLTLLAKIGGG